MYDLLPSSNVLRGRSVPDILTYCTAGLESPVVQSIIRGSPTLTLIGPPLLVNCGPTRSIEMIVSTKQVEHVITNNFIHA